MGKVRSDEGAQVGNQKLVLNYCRGEKGPGRRDTYRRRMNWVAGSGDL